MTYRRSRLTPTQKFQSNWFDCNSKSTHSTDFTSTQEQDNQTAPMINRSEADRLVDWIERVINGDDWLIIKRVPCGFVVWWDVRSVLTAGRSSGQWKPLEDGRRWLWHFIWAVVIGRRQSGSGQVPRFPETCDIISHFFTILCDSLQFQLILGFSWSGSVLVHFICNYSKYFNLMVMAIDSNRLTVKRLEKSYYTGLLWNRSGAVTHFPVVPERFLDRL